MFVKEIYPKDLTLNNVNITNKSCYFFYFYISRDKFYARVSDKSDTFSLCRIYHRALVCLSRRPRWSGGLIFLPKQIYDGFLLMWCHFKIWRRSVLFRSDFRHNDRVDSLLECATTQAVMTVAQGHRNKIIRGLWFVAKQKSWRWIHAYVVQF